MSVDTPRIVTEPLGGSTLAQLLVGNHATPWIPAAPRGLAEWRAHVAGIAGEGDVPAKLAALAPALAAQGAAAVRLARVAAEGGVVVTTGQQSGLFGGPIYTWSKALSALAVADELERVLGVAVAPVFWAATDDADLAEASVTAVAVPGGAERIVLPPPSGVPGGTATSLVPLPDVSALLERLATAAGSAALAHPIEVVRRAYAPGQMLGGAYVTLLRLLLEPLGIAVLDAGHAAVRSAGGAVTASALRESAAVAVALAERTSALTAAGFRPQVADMEALTLVFSWRDGVKTRIPAMYAAAALAGDSAARSPNVLLRPIVERALLPTVAYMAGPGELAYFAQVDAVARALGSPAPVALPRWSCTIVERKVQRLLDKYDFTPSALQDPHAAERRHASRALPDEARGLIELARAQLADLDSRLRAVSTANPDLLASSVGEGHTRRAAWLVEHLERRLRTAIKRRETDAMRAIATARGSLFPFGQRQERTLNFLPFLARHGEPLLAAMRAAATEHARRLIGT